VNPDSIVANDGCFTKYTGEHSSFDRPEKLVILLHKYDAARRRGLRTHDEAIRWLRDVIAGDHRFCGDEAFFALIEDLDAVMKLRAGLRTAVAEVPAWISEEEEQWTLGPRRRRRPARYPVGSAPEPSATSARRVPAFRATASQQRISSSWARSSPSRSSS
jgi:hypothetical protein